jgi:alkanesulfonate monooxygenase SsuD/methylene tetrahydromethanopterin reductase-like flavin-dependent oxidoreductase (luciferase family)
MRNVYIADNDAAARDEIVADLVRIGDALSAAPGAPLQPAPVPGSRADAERQCENLIARQIVVAGGVETVAREIAASMTTLGVDVFLANVHLAGVEDSRVRRTVTRFATEVVPLVKQRAGAG